MKIEKPKRFFLYYNKLYFVYKMMYTRGLYYETPMHGWDEWAVFIGFDNYKWFGREDTYYDGHTATQFFFLGLTVGKYYSYSWGEDDGK